MLHAQSMLTAQLQQKCCWGCSNSAPRCIGARVDFRRKWTLRRAIANVAYRCWTVIWLLIPQVGRFAWSTEHPSRDDGKLKNFRWATGPMVKSLKLHRSALWQGPHGPQAGHEHRRQKTVTLSLKALLAAESGQLWDLNQNLTVSWAMEKLT